MKSALKLVGAAVMFTGIWGATGSFAGLLDKCQVYAQNSQKQQQENSLRKCNLQGEYWTTDLKKHTAYCKSVPPQKWKAAFKQRQDQLKACK